MSKPVLLAIILITLTAYPFCASASANSQVGVQKGDWIRYNVRVTGNPSSDENITWAKMEIVTVQGPVITVNVQTEFANGTLFPENGIVLNLDTGAIGDGFFVPTNIAPGDKYKTEYEGIVNITGMGTLEAGGAQRSVILGSAALTNYFWDKQTGIMVAATSTYPTYTMYTTTSQTNIWQPQILGLNQEIFYAIIAIVITILVAFFLSFLFWHRKTGAK